MDVPADWTAATETILGRCRRVMVMGPPDAGKSSFCRALLGAAAAAGRSAAIIDADVGQKFVGPPAAITSAFAASPSALESLVFVGATDPVRGYSRVVLGITDLLALADAELSVVNTSGLLSGPGRRLKAAKIASVAPDLIVAVGRDRSLNQILSTHEHVPSLRVESSPLARRRNRSERRRARQEAFRRYFADARLRSVAFHRRAKGEWPDSIEGLLVGLADREGRDVALGIVRMLDPEQGSLRILMPKVSPRLLTVKPGSLRLDGDCRESLLPRKDARSQKVHGPPG